MKVGIGLPTGIPGVRRDQILEWEQRAESAGFSTLGTVDRLVYPNPEPLVALGVGLGSRDDDYEVSGVSKRGRGKRADEMLAEIRRLWPGDPVGHAGGVGPDVSGDPPQLVVGGTADQAFRRAARYGDGWIMGASAPNASRTWPRSSTRPWGGGRARR